MKCELFNVTVKVIRIKSIYQALCQYIELFLFILKILVLQHSIHGVQRVRCWCMQNAACFRPK